MADGVLRTSSALIWRDARDIVRVQIFPEVFQTVTTARENVEAVRTIKAGRRLPTLVNIRGLRGISGDARQVYAGGNASEFATAIAFVIGSPLATIVANIF